MSYYYRKPPVEVRLRRWKYVAVVMAVFWLSALVLG